MYRYASSHFDHKLAGMDGTRPTRNLSPLEVMNN